MRLYETVALSPEARPADGTATEALLRILSTSWSALGRQQSVVAAAHSSLRPTERGQLHQPVIERLAVVMERGQRSGDFRRDAPVDWLVSVYLALVHTAAEQVQAGQVTEENAGRLLPATVLGALSSDGSGRSP